jgi:hypothetical protein
MDMDPDREEPPEPWFGWLAWCCSGFALLFLVVVILVLAIGFFVTIGSWDSPG